MTKEDNKLTGSLSKVSQEVSKLKKDGSSNTVTVRKKQRRRFVAKKEAVAEPVGAEVDSAALVEASSDDVMASSDSTSHQEIKIHRNEVTEEPVLEQEAAVSETAEVPSEPVKEPAAPAVATPAPVDALPPRPTTDNKTTGHKPAVRTDKFDEDDDKPKKKVGDKKAGARSKKQRGKQDYLKTLDDDNDGSIAFKKRAKVRMQANAAKHAFKVPTKPIIHEVAIPETITIADLGQKMSVKATVIIKKLMKMGVMATINEALDQETAVLIVEELGHKAVLVQATSIEDQIAVDYQGSELMPRAPIVTIMGHVDHGKTSLLDAIRAAKVAMGEAGGITQHIGAYHVETPKGMVTFLDTPGHAAFSAMRARGTKCTDIVVLVVAADDGVMPQTIEAIQHAKAGGVQIVVAVNKMDKPEADVERIKNELTQHEVIPEDWGGDTQFIGVSAKEQTGLDELLEAILLQSEVLELRAVVEGSATGVVVESRLDKGRGPIATVLVQNGTLKQGDIIVAGSEFGRVRALINEVGAVVGSAGPSIPVEVLGLSGPAVAGDVCVVVSSEKQARDVVTHRQSQTRQEKSVKLEPHTLENLFERIDSDTELKLNMVIKADVQGSVEALSDVLLKLSTEDVTVTIVGRGVGGINESDVNLALATDAVLVGFNVRADAQARKVLDQEELKVYYFSIIYEVVDTIKSAIHGITGPKYKEEILGFAQVRDVFRSSKLGAIAGCMVAEGYMHRDRPIRVLRDNVVIYEGELESLRRFKDDVKEARNGVECGIGVKDYNDVRVGDHIECYEQVEIKLS